MKTLIRLLTGAVLSLGLLFSAGANAKLVSFADYAPDNGGSLFGNFDLERFNSSAFGFSPGFGNTSWSNRAEDFRDWFDMVKSMIAEYKQRHGYPGPHFSLADFFNDNFFANHPRLEEFFEHHPRWRDKFCPPASAVPVPAAAWLFGSALAVLVGRKQLGA